MFINQWFCFFPAFVPDHHAALANPCFEDYLMHYLAIKEPQ